MRHHIITLSLALILGIFAVTVIFVIDTLQQNSSPHEVACTMDAKMCPDGSAVGRVGPNCEFAPCPETPTTTTPQDEVQEYIDAHADLIVLESPLRDDTITSPVTLTGKARGTWYFEASFPIIIVDWDGRIIGEGFALADDNWMTEDFVPFTATVTFDLSPDTPYNRGAIILKKDNPSGLSEHDDAVEIPIVFGTH